MSPDMLDVDGRVGRYLRLILSATAPLSALMRNVEVYFSTNAYAPIDGTRSKNGDWIPANHPTNGTPFEVLLDMHSLTAGGNAWRDEIVRRVRIDFDGTIPETIRIHEISMVYLGTATVGAPSGTPVGAYADSASIAPAVASAATTAQWPNVTGTGRPADNATNTAPPNANRVRFSRMEGNQGYGVLFNPSSLANVVDYGEFQGLRFFKTTATATAAGQQISIGNAPSSAPAFKLTPGERVSVQARVEVAGVAAANYVFVLWGFEVDGVTQGVIASVSGGVTYIGGGVVSFFADVPAWARQGRLELYGYSSGAGSYQVAISEPMVSGAIAGQTLHAAFTPGPNSFDGADVTAQNTAFDTARVNGVLAATLTTQSATAASQAATATSTLAAIASDTVLSRGEKPAVVLEWEAISDEYADIDAKAAALSVTTERTTWQTARSALDAYLSSLSPPWYDTSADTVIVAATFGGKFRDYYAARNVLLNKLVQVASTLALWPNVTGTGRPADNATNTAAPNANRVQNSLFETGTNNAEWGTYGDSGVTANPATLSTFGGFPSTVISGSVPNNTARVILSSNRTIPVTAGETIFVGVGANTGATTVVSAQVLFMNASNAYITEIGVGAVAANTNGRSTGFITVPAGATQGVLRVQLSSTSSGSVSATIYQPMVSGAVAGQTLLPAFTRGLNALDGADVTAQNTAAAIAGQAWAATNGAQALVDNRLVPVGSNAVVNSDFTRGKFGFGWGGGGFESQWGVNLTGTPNWFGQRNVMWATVSGVLASGTERDLSPRTIWQGFPSADAPLFALPVVPNERLFASVLAAAHRCTFVLYILIFDAAFNLISAPGVGGGRSGGAANGDPANFDLLTVTGNVPANARWAIPMFRMLGTGGTDPYIFFTEPMFGKMAAGQTVVPSYVSGRTDLLADRTADNTAANANALGGTAAATVAGNITTAQNTANSKNRTFTGAATPVGPQAGDYWSIPGEQRLRRWSGSAWEVQLEFIANARTSFAVSMPTTSSFAQLGVGTLGVGPNGTTQVSATINYSPQSGGSGPRSGAIELTVDWRPVPGTGSWTQIGSSQTGSTATRAADLAPGEPGDITLGAVTIVRTLAGPVSVANNEFRVTGRLTGDALAGTPNNAIISWVP
jgi:hypothetical protein